MPHYSQELREQIVKKMMPPSSQTVAAISRETGISQPTLYVWKKPFRTQGYVVPSKSSNPDRWDGKAKLAAVIQTAAMNESERSAYCREYGLYVEQLDAWTQSFEAMDPLEGPVSKADLAAGSCQQCCPLFHAASCKVEGNDSAWLSGLSQTVPVGSPLPRASQRRDI